MTAILTTSPDVFTVDCRGKAHSPNLGAELFVIGRSWPKGTDVDAIIAGEVPATSVSLTSDGRSWHEGWHTGPESGETVYVERIEADGRGMHGFIDAASRRLVQVG